MSLLEYLDAPSPIHRFDPRVRLLVCALLLCALTYAQRVPVLWTACGATGALILLARLPLRALARRLIALNLFLALWWVTLPFTDPQDGARIAASATARANAMVLVLSLLVSTIETSALAHALAHLRIPRKLVQLLLFTIRYAEVLWAEQQRMQRAMRARAFRPRLRAHAYRSLARLVGMLLVRSLDRADRIHAAMKCRGYRGEFYLLHHFHYHPRDAWFAATGLALGALLVYGGRG